jgi:cleavage and polyadenylation specificity factor subunit 2
MWNDSQRPDDKWDRGKVGSNIMMDGTLKLQVRINSDMLLEIVLMCYIS